MPYFREGNYRYLPDRGVQSTQEINVFTFPQWSSQCGANQGATLEYDTFREEHLADPTFELFTPFGKTHGVGTVSFTQRALEEFIILLKRTHMKAL